MNLNIPPYFDDFDKSKPHSQVLYVPGRNVQARELTQQQSILRYHIEKLASTLLKEGDVVEGMSYSIEGTKFTVTPGRVYLSGSVHDFPGQTIEITGVGVESVHVYLEESVVTGLEDNSLLDNYPETVNYLQEGAHRLKQIPRIALNSVTNPVIYNLVDGKVLVNNSKPETSVLQELLAKRLYDQSGNYKVQGLDIRLNKSYSNTAQHEIICEPGTAYILGYEVTKPSPSRLQVPKALTTREVIGELKSLVPGVATYSLYNTPVRSISRVLASITTVATMNKGITGGKDLLPNTPVSNVVWVSSSMSGSSPYELNTDYVVNGNHIDWSPGGAEPSQGGTYYVCYTYSKSLVSGEDFYLEGAKDVKISSNIINSLSAGSSILVDYDFYLHRRDRIYLDSEGKLHLVSGVPNLKELCVTPPDLDKTRLSLGEIYVSPENNETACTSSAIVRSSMEDIKNLIKRVDDMLYNQAIEDLDREAMDSESATMLKGIFTDGFLGFTKCDLTHQDYHGALDVLDQNLIIPFEHKELSTEVLTKENIRVCEDTVIMPDFTEEIALSQSLCSDTINVNKYWVFTPPVEIVSVDSFANMQVYQDSGLTIPNGVRVNYSDNTSKLVSVVWENSVKTDELGKFQLRGRIDDYEQEIVLNIEVIPVPDDTPYIVSVDDYAPISVYQGSGLVLPTGILATYNDGSYSMVPVLWSTVIDTDVLNTYHMTGVVPGYSKGTKLTVSVVERPDTTPKIVSVADYPEITVYLNGGLTLPTGILATYTDSSTRMVPVMWTSGITTDSLGDYVIQGIIEGYTKGTSVKVKVVNKPEHDPNIASVENPADISVYQNDSLTLPTGAVATYSDGSKRVVGIMWTTMVTTSEITRKTIKGNIEGYPSGVTVNVDIKARPDTTPIITSIPALNTITIYQYGTVSLPNVIKANYSDSNTRIVPVYWNNTLDSKALGTFSVTGTVEGYSKGVSVTVKVIPIPDTTPKVTSITNPKDITIYQYQGLTIPTGVQAKFTDGSSRVVPVAWINTVDTEKVGTQTLTGTVESYSGQATMKVNVLKAETFTGEGVLKLSPSADNFTSVSNQTRTVDNSTTKYRNFAYYSDYYAAGGSRNSDVTTDTSGVTSTTSVSTVDTVASYARTIEINLSASGLMPSANNLACYMDGVQMRITPTNGTASGTKPNTVKANAQGNASCKFTIPSYTRTGSKDISLENDACSARAVFVSKGINRVITTTITTIGTKYVLRYVDPLAQTFCFTEDRFLSSLNLYFSTKDSKAPITVEIRDVVNGYPGETIFSRQVLQPEDINVSEDGSVPTRVVLPTPVYCQANSLRAVCILTESLDYNMYVATLNQKLLGSEEYVSRQPYTEGVLFTSSNAVTWTPMQDTDLKFDMFCCAFKGTGTITFTPSEKQIETLILLADTGLLPNTSIKWEYRTDEETSWQTIENYISKQLTYTTSSSQLRLTMTPTAKTCPLVQKDTIAFMGLKQDPKGCYVHRQITTSQAYSQIKVVIEHYNPKGTFVTPSITLNDSAWMIPGQESTTALGGGWFSTTYKMDIYPSGENTRFRTKLELFTTESHLRPKVRKLMVILT